MQTTLCLSGPAFLSILLLIAGFIAVAVQMKTGSNTLKNGASVISPPMIQMSQYQGPWPKCLGMEGSECVSYIETNAHGVESVMIVPQYSQLTEDFRKDRVRVFVDDDGIVTAIPDRG